MPRRVSVCMTFTFDVSMWPQPDGSCACHRRCSCWNCSSVCSVRALWPKRCENNEIFWQDKMITSYVGKKGLKSEVTFFTVNSTCRFPQETTPFLFLMRPKVDETRYASSLILFTSCNCWNSLSPHFFQSDVFVMQKNVIPQNMKVKRHTTPPPFFKVCCCFFPVFGTT